MATVVPRVRSQRVQELQALGAVDADADAVAGAVYWISLRLTCLLLERIVVLCLGVRFTVRCGSGAHAPARVLCAGTRIYRHCSACSVKLSKQLASSDVVWLLCE